MTKSPGKSGEAPAKRTDWSLFVYGLLTPASVLMLFLSLPGYDLWFFAFVALVPLFLILQRAKARTGALIMWLGGYLFFFLAFSWLSHLTPIGWVLLAFYLSLWFLLFAVVARRVTTGHPRLPFVVGVPVVWVAIELLRGVTVEGFCWHYVGHSLYSQRLLIQVADFSGVYGVSFVAVTVNALLAWLIHLLLQGRRRRRGALLRAVLGTIYTVLLVLAALAYGRYRLEETRPVAGPRISVVQGNIPLDVEDCAKTFTWRQVLERRHHIFDKHRRLTLGLLDVKSDMVVWPETTVSYLEGEKYGREDYSAHARKRVREIRKTIGRPFLLGSVKLVRGADEDAEYNAAYFFPTEDGPFEVYLKIHLVPFGEYIPFRSVPWIKALIEDFMPTGYEATLSAGSELVLFRLKETLFATPICYEDTKPSLVSKFRRKGAQFIVNLTNDGWFADTAELDQHLANSVFRTVENRVGLVRAANTGISAFVDCTGAVTSVLVDERTGRRREIEGVLTDTVFVDGRVTFYTKHGDFLAWTTVGWVVVFLLLRAGRRWAERDRLK